MKAPALDCSAAEWERYMQHVWPRYFRERLTRSWWKAFVAWLKVES